MTKLIYLTWLALAFVPVWSFADSCADDLVFHPTRADFVYASGFRTPTQEQLLDLRKSVNTFGKLQTISDLKALVLYLHEFSYVEHEMMVQLGSEDPGEKRAARKLMGRMSYMIFDKGVERLSQFASEDLAPYFAELCVVAGNLVDSTTPDESLIQLLIKLTGVASHVADLRDYRMSSVMLLTERLAGTPMTQGRFDEFRYWTNDWVQDMQDLNAPEDRIFALTTLMCLQILRTKGENLNPDFFAFLASHLPRNFARRKKPLKGELREQTVAFLRRIVSTLGDQPGLLPPRELERIRFIQREVFDDKE